MKSIDKNISKIVWTKITKPIKIDIDDNIEYNLQKRIEKIVWDGVSIEHVNRFAWSFNLNYKDYV